MKELDQPYNVTFKIESIEPLPYIAFNQTNGGFIRITAPMKIEALLKDLSGEDPYATFNITTSVDLKVLPQIRAMRGAILDYSILKIESLDGSTDVDAA